MAFNLFDRVQETSSTTGTGDYTLAGALTGFQSFGAVGDGNTATYEAFDSDINGNPVGGWEVGIGTYHLSTTSLTRTTILASSNAGAAVNWLAGTRRLGVTYPSSQPQLGVGTNAPVSRMHLVTQDSLIPIQSDVYGTTNPRILTQRFRGTLAAPRRVNTGDQLFNVVARGGFAPDDVSNATASGGVAGVLCQAEDNFTSTAQGASISLTATQMGTTINILKLICRSDAGGTVYVTPRGFTPGGTVGGYSQFYNAINPNGTDATQTNLSILGWTGNGPNPPGVGFTTANYFNSNIFCSVVDSSFNATSVFGIGAEGNWTHLGSFPVGGYGFYIFDQVANKTAIGIGYSQANRVFIGSAGTGNGYDLLVYGGIWGGASAYMMRTIAAWTDASASSSPTLGSTGPTGATTPTKWIAIDDNGTVRHIPAW